MSTSGQYAAGFGGVLNLPLELPTRPPWRGLVPSFSVHALVIAGALLAPFGTRSVEDRRETRVRHAVPLFLPARAIAKETSAVQIPSSVTRKGLSVSIEAEADPVNVRIDMNSIQLSFAKDFTNQLPAVVQAYAGVLALIDRRDPGFARYLIEPPDWTVRETLQDISGNVKVEMYPPQAWRLLRSVAARSSLSLDRYQVCALFGSSFNRCLQNAIREKARDVPHGGAVAVRSARVAFAGGSPCGVNVLDVSFASAAVRRP